jgi:hypothetical protein
MLLILRLLASNDIFANHGRRILIGTPDRVKELIALMQASLPSNMRISLNEGHTSTSCQSVHRVADGMQVRPVAFDPNAGLSHAVLTSEPFLVEIRALLIANERFGWLLPVFFCIGELLTAHELITKIDDAFRILKSWSEARTPDESTWAELPSASPHMQ